MYCDLFLWENFLKVFGSGQSDMCSGNSMTICTSCYVVNVNNVHICSSNWITPNTAQASVDYRRVGRSMFCHAILITRIPWVHVCVHYTSVIVEVPRGNNTSDLEPKTFKKCSHKKNTSQCPWWEEEIKVSPGLKDLVLPWWIGVRIFDEGEICAVETAQSNNALLCIV